MAAKKQAVPAYEAEREYDVRLKRVIWIGAVKYLPRDRHIMAGALLNDSEQVPADAVDEAVLIEPRPARAQASAE